MAAVPRSTHGVVTQVEEWAAAIDRDCHPDTFDSAVISDLINQLRPNCAPGVDGVTSFFTALSTTKGVIASSSTWMLISFGGL